MKITERWLKSKSACEDGIVWFKNQKKRDSAEILKALMTDKRESYALSWANWLIVRLMTHKQKVQYAVFAAEQVIGIFEEKYPDDKRPRKAIEAAKEWIRNPSERTRKRATSYAAAAAAASAAAASAAAAAASAASAAASAAANADYAASSSSYAASAAANADYADYASVRRKMKLKILNYGIGLLKSKALDRGEENP